MLYETVIGQAGAYSGDGASLKPNPLLSERKHGRITSLTQKQELLVETSFTRSYTVSISLS